jgi:hypothetical protein
MADMERVVRAYVNIRDARAKRKREWEAEDAKLSADQDRLGMFLLKHLNDAKVNSSSTNAGTFYKQKVVMPSASDWEAFYAWIAENNAFDFLERRIKRTAITEYMETNENRLPPGVSTFDKYEVHVRKS